MRNTKIIFIISFFILGALCRDISTKQDYYKILTINENDALEISCNTKDPIKFLYPSGSETSHPEINTSNFTISRVESDFGDVHHIFRRPKAIHGDSGFYGCLNLKDARNQKFVKRRPFNLTYFYVKSKTNAFVEELSLSIHYGPEGSDLHINCRPTSRDLHVELEHYYRGNRTVLTSDPSVTFNPTYGFELKNATVIKNDGLYVCKTVNADGRSQELVHSYKIHKKTKINEPQIGMEEIKQHIIRGQTLRLKCYTMVTNVTSYAVNWDSPMNNQSSQFINSLQMDANKLLVQSHLVKINVEDSDEGYYRCLFRNYDTNITKSDETYVKIYDPSFKYLNVIIHRTNETFVRHLGDELLWIAEIDAYPAPTIKWLNPKGEHITNTKKYTLFNILSTIGLLIKNINSHDAGIYLLEVSNGFERMFFNFHLDVKNF
ncbi:platelet-derived growth factor receptor alpha-like [Leptopilina boulardi]|uniref:platelet-derived growth factor receptor alpha-like n=1 Tax=Leptopilina boulardi TaxID=63433 RepID=UPI0021F5922C|nr:platelet-derived growth factor receptor alpha-like [Leptopilina boulardi]